jgi:hypothetical protein
VDTVGLDDTVPVDRYRTPHTKQLHVVERFHLTNGGKNIEVVFTVEDPGAFNMPWKGKVDFERGRGNRSGHFDEIRVRRRSHRLFRGFAARRGSDPAGRHAGLLRPVTRTKQRRRR